MRRVDLVRHLVWMSLACGLAVHAQYPNRPLRLIVPFVANDFAPISQGVAGGLLLSVHPSLPVRSVKALVALQCD